jgi:predicted peptidase
MMHAMLPLVLVGFMLGDVPVTVMTKDGKTIKGSLDVTAIKMKTSFGETTFEPDKIASIQFGNPDVVTTRDQIKLQGAIILDEISLKFNGSSLTLGRETLAAIHADRGPIAFEPGKIVDGTARNNMTYHVRLPRAFDVQRGMPALVVLHGSNMNSKAYLSTVVAAWPKLAEDYILIGLNGEFRVANTPDDNPAFNYSGINYVGKSKFKGYPGTDRESPGLVPEVIAELRERLRINKIFVGGHSQGGFVTYSVLMNFPELVTGAFPISAGLWVQCEPTSYDNVDIRSAQRRVALAVIHGENDPVVPFSQGKSAFESFDDDGFPTLHFFIDPSAGHMFARLPVERAVRWLEQMTTDDPESLVRFAEQQLAVGEYRDATAAIERVRRFDSAGKLEPKLRSLMEQIDRDAESLVKKLLPAITTAEDDAWVKDFTNFRTQFQFAAGAADVLDAYRKLRTIHEEPAQKLFNEARGDFQQGKRDAGYAKYDEIVKKYYASSVYRYAKPAIESRPASDGK